MMAESVGVGTTYLMAAEAAALVSNYAIHIILARFLGPAAYGVFGILLSLYLINGAFLNTGFAAAVSKFMSQKGIDKEALFKTSLRVQLLLAGAFTAMFIFFSTPLSVILGDESLSGYVVVLGFTILPMAIFSLYLSGYLNGLKAFKPQAKIKIAYPLLRFLFAVVLVFLGWGILGVLIGYFLATVAAMILSVAVFVSFRRKGWLSHSGVERISAWGLLKFTFPLTISALLFASIRNVNVLFLKVMLHSDALVGIYTSAVTLANAPALLFSALPMTILPSISKSYSEQNADLTRQYIQKALRYTLLCLLPLLALVAASAREVITFFYSSQYASAGSLLTILFAGAIFQTLFAILVSMTTGSGKPSIEMGLTVMFMILLVLFNILLIPRLELVGGAVATLLSSVLSCLAAFGFVFHRFRVFPLTVSVIKTGMASLLIFGVGSLWKVSGWMLIPYYFLLLSLYLLLLWLFREWHADDGKLLRKILLRSQH